MSEFEFDRNEVLVSLTAEIVSAYVQKNVIPVSSLGELIGSVHTSLKGLGQQPEAPTLPRLEPAIAIKKSLTPGAITCLECGRSLKSLKRHLTTHHALSPEEYRTKWKLPNTYPMVSPQYAAERSALAVKMGLGQHRAKTPAPATKK